MHEVTPDSSSGDAAVREKLTLKVATLVLLASWFVLRDPDLVRFPRFWAEESAFASAATRLPWWQSLFYVYWRAGYFSWPPGVGAVLGLRLLPTPDAPALTMVLAFILQLTPAIAVLWLRFPFSIATVPRCLAAMALLVNTSAGQGIAWLNALSSQMHLGTLTAVLVMASARQPSAFRSAVSVGALVAAGLSGAYAVFLTPVFLVAAVAERDAWRWRQFSAIAITFVLQCGVVLYGRYGLGLVNERRGSSGWSIDSLLMGVRETMTIPMFGELSVMGSPMRVDGFTTLSVLLVGLAIVVLIRSATRTPRDPDGGLVALLGSNEMRSVWAFGVVVGAISIFAYDGVPAGRYAMVPGALTMIMLLTAAHHTRSIVVRSVMACAILASIVTGLHNPRFPEALRCNGATSRWIEEAKAWTRAEETRLPICPEGWTVKLYPQQGDAR